MTIKLIHGDCLDVMKDIPDGSIDCVITDPPYQVTNCKWDIKIPFEPMWEQLKRVTKKNGAIVLFGSEPFSSALRMSNVQQFRYDWYWNKRKGANIMSANRMPLKVIEVCSVFSEKSPQYFPQKRNNPKGIEKRNQYKIVMHKTIETVDTFDAGGKKELNTSENYDSSKLLPTSLIEFSKPNKPLHPTQKPVALMEYLIRTYTNENETVLDFCFGSGTCGVACKNLNRNFIGIELDKKYFEIAKERIENTPEKLI